MSQQHLSHLLYFKLYLYLFDSSSMFDHCLPIVCVPCVIRAFRHGLWSGFGFRHIHNQTLIQLLIVSKRIKKIDIKILTGGELLGDVPITFHAFKARMITSIYIIQRSNVVSTTPPQVISAVGWSFQKSERSRSVWSNASDDWDRCHTTAYRTRTPLYIYIFKKIFLLNLNCVIFYMHVLMVREIVAYF